jgi:acyl-CoA thioester hydrolase
MFFLLRMFPSCPIFVGQNKEFMIQPYQPEIRFSDIDAMGHVNNAVYLSYFEQARIHFFSQWLEQEWNWNTAGILVARNEVDYKKPLFLTDKVHISVAVQHIGTRSFTLLYKVERINNGASDLCSTGASVLVCFNAQTQQTTPIPERWRAKLEAMKTTAL